MLYLCVCLSALIPYLLCGINPAIIVAEIKNGIDIRQVGSGNPGLTNTLRTQGKGAAVAVLLFDVLKGVLSLMIIRLLFYYIMGVDIFDDTNGMAYVSWLALTAAVLGHCFPVYYGFKGGKAVLVTVSALFVVDWFSALALLSLFAVIVLLTRYVSLGSVIAAALMPVCVYLKSNYMTPVTQVFTATAGAGVVALILLYMHRKNINRLINKEEKKLFEKKKDV